jgi:hypothetical protein
LIVCVVPRVQWSKAAARRNATFAELEPIA